MHRRPWLMLALCATYAGCAARGPALPAVPGTASRPVRVQLSGPMDSPDPEEPRTDLERFLSLALGRGLVARGAAGRYRPALAESWTRAPAEGQDETVWSFRLDPAACFSTGQPLAPQDVIAAWEVALRRPTSAARWLLEPVVGSGAFARGEAERVAGLEAHVGELRIRLSRPSPDLLERLAHPALRVWSARQDGPPVGAGSFRLASPDRAVASPSCGGRRPTIPAFDLRAGATPAVLAGLGEIDLTVVRGREASPFLEPGGPTGDRFVVAPLPSWDRTYFLWLDPGWRWTRDPSFRRWLSSSVDRDDLLDGLFDGRGAVACGLVFDCGEMPRSTAHDSPGAVWRIPRGLTPHFALAFDAGDPDAGALAARLKAGLEARGLSIDLEAAAPREEADRLRSGRAQAALLVQPHGIPDPVLALQDTLWGFGAEVADALSALQRAAREPPATSSRRAAAAQAQALVLDDGRIVPLVRVRAFVVRARGLARVTEDRGVELSDPGEWAWRR